MEMGNIEMINCVMVAWWTRKILTWLIMSWLRDGQGKYWHDWLCHGGVMDKDNIDMIDCVMGVWWKWEILTWLIVSWVCDGQGKYWHDWLCHGCVMDKDPIEMIDCVMIAWWTQTILAWLIMSWLCDGQGPYWHDWLCHGCVMDKDNIDMIDYVIGLTRSGFKAAGSRLKPTMFGFPDLPEREVGTLLIWPPQLVFRRSYLFYSDAAEIMPLFVEALKGQEFVACFYL